MATLSMRENSPRSFGTVTDYEVKVAASAATELEDAVRYIAERLAAPHAMASLLDAFDLAIGALGVNPYFYSVDGDGGRIVDPRQISTSA